MKIRVLGGGWSGCPLAAALIADGHEVELHEIRDRLFAGASGSIPARLHLGFHYPRSRITRAACQDHAAGFMLRYGDLSSGVAVNIYAIARDRSMVDFDQYVRTLRGEVDFVEIHDPAEFGVHNVEGALLTGERHIVTARAREHFEDLLEHHVHFGRGPGAIDDAAWDLTIDCTFCANDSAGVDRYEPCLVLLLAGPTDRAVTIMDGPFGSLYPWDPELGLCSLSSALWTPFSKTIRTWVEARQLLDRVTGTEIDARTAGMVDQMREYYPAIESYRVVDHLLSIRAMPLSGADTRLVDVVRVGDRALRVRAGKIDAVLQAEQIVRAML